MIVYEVLDGLNWRTCMSETDKRRAKDIVEYNKLSDRIHACEHAQLYAHPHSFWGEEQPPTSEIQTKGYTIIRLREIRQHVWYLSGDRWKPASESPEYVVENSKHLGSNKIPINADTVCAELYLLKGRKLFGLSGGSNHWVGDIADHPQRPSGQAHRRTAKRKT